MDAALCLLSFPKRRICILHCSGAGGGGAECRMTRSICFHTNRPTYLESVVAGEDEVAVRKHHHVLLPDPRYLEMVIEIH